MRKLPLLLALLAAGCSHPAASLYVLAPPPPAAHVANRLGRVEVRDVALPQYASAPEIAVQAADGSVHPLPNSLWADSPGNAITRTLAEQISAVSGATAIAAPWPLATEPDRRLEVRIGTMLAGADGRFRLAGQYFVSGGGDVARRFDIAVPLASEGPEAIAQALGLALQRLALQIAALK